MDELYRGYRVLYVEQKEIVKERLIAAVVDSLDSLSDVVCAQLLSIAQSYRHLNAITDTQANQELIQAQNVVQETGRMYGQQLASSLTQGLNSLNILQTVGSIAFKEEPDETQTETEINQTGHTVIVKEEEEEEDEIRFVQNSNIQDFVPNGASIEESENIAQSNGNVETVNSSEGGNEHQSNGMMDDEESATEESQDEPTITVVNYEEFDEQFIGNQDSVLDGSLDEESENVFQQEGNGHAIDSLMVDSHENDNLQSSGQEVLDDEENITEAISEPGQAGPSFALNTASTLTRRSVGASTAKKINFDSESVGNSLTHQQGALQTGTRKGNVKRKTGRSAKSNAPKRSRVVPASTIAAQLQNQMNGDFEEEDDPEFEAISFRAIVRRLDCGVPGCTNVFPGKVQLDGHLLTKHAIEKYACKVKDCTESYATSDELTTHLNTTHGNLDKEWPCAQCEVTCNTYQDLYHHNNYFHEYGLFACSADKCNFTEKTRRKVHNHQRNHRPAKYRCTYVGCSSSFKQKSHLTLHLRVHSKEKSFLCSQCNKAFARKDDLTTHERVHSGLKPFSCIWSECDYSASQRSNVLTHIRGVHFGLPKSKTAQAEQGIIDNRDARLFVKKSTGN